MNNLSENKKSLLSVNNELKTLIENFFQSHKNLDDLNYLELFEILLDKNENLKNENKKLILSKLSCFFSVEKQEVENDLELKLNKMKIEIDELKEMLKFPNKEIQIRQVKPASPIDLKSASINKHPMDSISNDLNKGLNLIITNYSEKLAEIHQQIVDFNPLEKKILPKTNSNQIF